MKFAFFSLCLLLPFTSFTQKIPLDHSVYDGWQNIGEKAISNNGRYVLFTINPQEGDGLLVVRTADSVYKTEIPRGYNAAFTDDSRFLICKIRPLYKDTRDAKIKKKKPEDMPKDSLAIMELGKDSILKIPGIKSFKTPERSGAWLAFLSEKGFPEGSKLKAASDSLTQLNSLSKMADSLFHIADSLRNKAAEAKIKGLQILQSQKKESKKPDVKPSDEQKEEGTELVLRNLENGQEKKYKLVKDYLFSKKGNRLIIETTKKNTDSLSKSLILWINLSANITDTVMKNFNEARNYALDEEAGQLAFVAERDSAIKSPKKFYRLWYYKPGMDSATLIADRNSAGVTINRTISENYALQFSKEGKRLFLGLAPIRAVKDTTQPDFEKAGLDIWNYKDDELQPVQLKNLDKDLKKSYLAIWEPGTKKLIELANEKFPDIQMTREGDGDIFYAVSDSGKRVARQWQGFTINDVFSVNATNGEKTLIAGNIKGSFYPSYTGKYLLWYDDRRKGYSIYNSVTGKIHKAGADIKTLLYDEENDVPDDPNPYGMVRWMQDDKYVLIYDRYDVWKIDPENNEPSQCITKSAGRKSKSVYRYLKLDPEEKFITPNQQLYFEIFNETNKHSGWGAMANTASPLHIDYMAPANVSSFVKALRSNASIFFKETYTQSRDIYYTDNLDTAVAYEKPDAREKGLSRLTQINPQQTHYLWGSAELFVWKAYTGKITEGVVYKPEHFDSTKKYPMIVYFYERNSNTLYNYQAPSPTPSRLNISFFVSRGYIVFVPDIWYKDGHPGKSAYDYIMSGTRALIKKGFVDSTRMGLQGQSWGGYQTAYLITQTNLFSAAWAGAPVVNMFSAYGGIRWESGVNRQFQYERTQSRIGATIWERPDLYIENSPLFHLQKVKTPLVIMSNDADGAVPWYQGIEFFTAMRRLNKPIWLLSYNGEAHNLVERRNRKDIQIREQQFFDWLLKGEAPPKWITEGVPATSKGIDWGLK